MASLFHSVGKYRKLWISILMGLSMLTFILCAGNKSDLNEAFFRWYRPHGDSVASVNGVALYREDIEALKAQRAAANTYVKSLADQLIDYIGERTKNLPEKMEEEQQKVVGELKMKQAALLARRRNDVNFFGTGTKTEEIVDFKIWLAEADRLGVFLTDNQLRNLVAQDVYRIDILNLFGGGAAEIDRNMQRQAEARVRENSHGMNASTLIRKGLMDEYRVRIAKLAAIELQFASIQRNMPKRLKPTSYFPSELTRLPLTPAQIFDFYVDNRTEIDVALLEIPVEKFVDQVGEPDAKTLEALFAKHKGDPYNPASSDPGFRNQHLIKVKWITGDPSSPFFKTLARSANDFAAWPIGSLSPMPLADALRIAGGQAVLDARLAQEYELRNHAMFGNFAPNFPFDLGGDPALSMANYLAYSDPVAKTGFFGALARPDSIFAAVPLFAADGYLKNKALIAEGVKIELKARVPYVASLVGSGAGGPLNPTVMALAKAEADRASLRVVFGDLSPATPGLKAFPPPLLPLPIVRAPIIEAIERQQASPIVTANILFLKKQMEDEKVVGDELQMKRVLDRFGPDYAKASQGREKNRNLGLEVHETKKFFGKYDVDSDDELKPLREAYDRYFAQINVIEGRDGINGKQPWKEADFPRIFFDGTESIGIGGAPRFAARPWPPTLTLGNPTQLAMMMQNNQQMGMDAGAYDEFNQIRTNREPNRVTTLNMIGYAEKPILIWKTEEMKDDPPRTLADAKDRVAMAWKVREAREKKALPYAQKIAEGLLKGSAGYGDALKYAGKDIDAKLIEVNRIAKLAQAPSQNPFQPSGDYGPFQLKGQIKYPREDTVQVLLSLNGLKEPVKIGVPEIDNLNAALFQEAAKANRGPTKFVQILTNQPRDRFFVAAINGPPMSVGQRDFATMLRSGAQPGQGRDTLLDRAQVVRGEEFYKTYLESLRKRFNVVMPKAGADADVGS